MSWQSYIDDHLMADIDGCHLTAAAIIGLDGTVWAQSSNFPKFNSEEITAITTDFETPGTLAPTGLHLAGTKYMVIQGESGLSFEEKRSVSSEEWDHSVILQFWDFFTKKKNAQGAGGVTVKKTSQALIIGIYDAPLTPGQCNMVVEKIGDYLIEQGL